MVSPRGRTRPHCGPGPGRGWACSTSSAGSIEKARPAFVRALEVDESNAEAHDGLAQVLVEQEQAGRRCLTRSGWRSWSPGNPWYVGHVGYLHDVLGEAEEAEEWYQRAADLDPLWTWPLVKLGWLRLSEAKAEAAAGFFKHASALDAQDGFAYQGLAESWEMRQDLRAGARLCEPRGARPRPGRPTAR